MSYDLRILYKNQGFLAIITSQKFCLCRTGERSLSFQHGRSCESCLPSMAALTAWRAGSQGYIHGKACVSPFLVWLIYVAGGRRQKPIGAKSMLRRSLRIGARVI